MKIAPELLRQCWFLAGPTAVGKTELSLRLASEFQAEIVSLDSMAIYRGMDIGTAKPSLEERARIPHHLLDVVEPHQEFSVADYLTAAELAAKEILGRGRPPLFVGGTGLYLRSLLRGVSEAPPADWEFRKTLEEEATGHPADWLWQRLNDVDAATAHNLHANDRRRIIRALEVHRFTGEPASRSRQEAPLPKEIRPPRVYWLHPRREWLYDRINRRVDAMFAAGLVDEVRGLLQSGSGLGRTARQGLGYREVIDFLEGRLAEAEAIELTKTRTRQFAKRQHTWFRNLEECQEIGVGDGDTEETLLKRILD